MYENQFIRNVLKLYINQQQCKFVIYPFGCNGVQVKNILKDCFDLNPCLIVDNEYAQYSPEIVNKDTLKEVWQQDMYVIITIENEEISAEITKELLEFIPVSNIINLQNLKQKRKNVYDYKGFSLKSFLPLMNCKVEDRSVSNKIKVRIVHRSPAIWNAIQTICRAFREDELFDVLLIIHNDWKYKESVRQAVENGYSYIMWDVYQAVEDQPDILILSGQRQTVLSGLLDSRKFAKLIVVASWSIVQYSSIEELWNRYKNDYYLYSPDYYLFDSLQYHLIKQSDYFSEQIVEMGNAKFDGIYQSVHRKRKYSGKWKKLECLSTTVLWTTSHGVHAQGVYRTCTFDLYAKTFFEYAYKNPQMGFIFRPSLGLVDEMLEFGFWSQSDIQYLQEYCDNSPNIVYDDTDTYDIAYSLADGILTDAFSGMVCSALPTLKPICAAYRSRSDISWHKELLDSLYSAYEDSEIIDFFEMLRYKQDPKLELRKIASEKYIKHFDGKNGWRIKEFIKEKYYEKIEDAFSAESKKLKVKGVSLTEAVENDSK